MYVFHSLLSLQEYRVYVIRRQNNPQTPSILPLSELTSRFWNSWICHCRMLLDWTTVYLTGILSVFCESHTIQNIELETSDRLLNWNQVNKIITVDVFIAFIYVSTIYIRCCPMCVNTNLKWRGWSRMRWENVTFITP